jgi:hypothetical protein
MTDICSLAKGHTVKNMMGLEGEYTLAKDYSYAQCHTKSRKTNIKEGERVTVRPTLNMAIKKCKILVVPNGELAAYGSVAYQSVLEAGDEGKLCLYFEAKQDVNLKDLDYIFRVYCIY